MFATTRPHESEQGTTRVVPCRELAPNNNTQCMGQSSLVLVFCVNLELHISSLISNFTCPFLIIVRKTNYFCDIATAMTLKTNDVQN